MKIEVSSGLKMGENIDVQNYLLHALNYFYFIIFV